MTKKRRSEELTCFLNVDLDIAAAQDLSPLVRALGPRAFDLHTGPAGAGYQTHLELNSRATEKQRSADATIKRFVTLLASLPSREKRLWNHATQRDFNIGIQGGLQPRTYELGLKAETLELAGSVNARVVVTVYGAEVPPMNPRLVPPVNRAPMDRTAIGRAGPRPARPRAGRKRG